MDVLTRVCNFCRSWYHNTDEDERSHLIVDIPQIDELSLHSSEKKNLFLRLFAFCICQKSESNDIQGAPNMENQSPLMSEPFQDREVHCGQIMVDNASMTQNTVQDENKSESNDIHGAPNMGNQSPLMIEPFQDREVQCGQITVDNASRTQNTVQDQTILCASLMEDHVTLTDETGQNKNMQCVANPEDSAKLTDKTSESKNVLFVPANDEKVTLMDTNIQVQTESKEEMASLNIVEQLKKTRYGHKNSLEESIDLNEDHKKALDVEEQKLADELLQVYQVEPIKHVDLLTKIGNVYRERAYVRGEPMHYMKAIGIYEVALVHAEECQDKADRVKVTCEATEERDETLKLFFQHAGVEFTKEEYLFQGRSYEKTLKKIRKQVKYKMKKPSSSFAITTQMKGHIRMKAERSYIKRTGKVHKYINSGLKRLFTSMIDDCKNCLAFQHTDVNFTGCGSYARTQTTPWSDIEFTTIQISPDQKMDKEYRKRLLFLVMLFHIRILGLGETVLPSLAIESLSEYADNRRNTKKKKVPTATLR